MNISNTRIKQLLLFLLVGFFSFSGFSQSETNTWKAQLAVGVNSPNQSAFVANFKAKSVNMPTVNLGLQRMFSRRLGAKLDYGFNRISDVDNTKSPAFKLNYSRVNAQLVYDLGDVIRLSNNLAIVGHAGPGYSWVKPLGDYAGNDTSFLNLMGGLEFHYGLSRTLSLFLDASYIYSLGGDYDPISDGFGSFNGNLITATLGLSFSLSGCYFCE